MKIILLSLCILTGCNTISNKENKNDSVIIHLPDSGKWETANIIHDTILVHDTIYINKVTHIDKVETLNIGDK